MKTILLALLFDQTVGDPSNAYHPVAWMGTMIAKLRRWGEQQNSIQQNNVNQFLYGLVIAFGGGGVMWTVGRVARTALSFLPRPIAWLAEAWLLQTMFSLSGLTNAAAEVQTALNAGDLPEARRLVSWHLVSRDTSELSEAQVAAATIESVGENLSDGVIAPLFFYLLCGLPGAVTYRYVNTCDAMLGYRDEAREWLGKGSARLDDFLNLVPARLTAVLILLAGAVQDGGRNSLEQAQNRWQKSVAIWRRDAQQTDSPNAGHAMSATAGALDISLEKVGQYNLGDGLRQPTAADIGRVIQLVRWATGCALLLFGLIRLFIGRRNR